ncbi:MAG: inorganic phosphate transporter [Bacteroidota bacterium]|nr:inorganic phosphate transporter [Bacteroidota bacterium]
MLGLSTGMFIVLILAVLAACIFEFINGFHDTANAVATVIYTKSLKPQIAVVWSGIWNFFGVYLGGIAVAMGIINLLPVEALVDQNIYHNMSMILSLIITAVIWNLGTWYFGIPCSSSHTLIGSIFGVGIAFMFVGPQGVVALNWHKVIDAGLSLLISPVIGFGFAILMMFIFKLIIKRKKFYRKPQENKKPPFWIRGILIITSTAVSYSHGSNDGQKGVGLIMIILIAIIPSYFALDLSKNPTTMIANVNQIDRYTHKIDSTKLNAADLKRLNALKSEVKVLKTIISHSDDIEGVPDSERFKARKSIITISRRSIDLLKDCENCKGFNLSKNEIKHFNMSSRDLCSYTEFAPWWVIILISLSLGLGTMFGWKRIVRTIGEKIGKSPLSYAQGASSSLVAASTIAASSYFGLPVSTTHVLSSGVAGSMVSSGGVANLQFGTIKNILIAWVITIPVTILLAGGLFLLFRTLL